MLSQALKKYGVYLKSAEEKISRIIGQSRIASVKHKPVEAHRHTTMCDSNKGHPLIDVGQRQV